MATCAVEGCSRPTPGRSWCNAHYLRIRKHGDPQAHIPIKESGGPSLCSTGCGRAVLARGYCATHYQRWRIDGTPGEVELRRVPGSADRIEKPCTTCREVKPMSDFYGDKRTRDGKQSDCKSCFRIRNRERRERRVYGLTPDDRAAIFEGQGGKCPICREERKLVIDHDHATGKVRGLLCDRCNRLLGVANDDVRLLTAAIKFLHQHSTA